jgi:hypothetical protein
MSATVFRNSSLINVSRLELYTLSALEARDEMSVGILSEGQVGKAGARVLRMVCSNLADIAAL